MSRQDIVALPLTLSALFLTFLIITSLFANIISSPHSSQTLLPPPSQHYHDGDPHKNGGVLDPLAEMATKSFSESWAYYSPYHPAAPFESSTREGCVVSQVNILQRHGARYPTTGATRTITAALAKLQAATSYDDTKLDFMKSYTYGLGKDDLVEYGADQSSSLGEETFRRYEHLIVEAGNLPFVRASGSKRVIASAQSWIKGFSAASEGLYPATVNLIIPETHGSNNTLDDEMCPAAANTKAQIKEFVDTAARYIATRLNSVAPGANLTAQDAYAIMHLCPFETVAKEAISPFCDLFSEEDFEVYEYAGDLEKFYNTGYGSPLGPIQGVGYISELIGRLTNSPPRQSPQTNNTLLASPETFPLDRTIYVDFTHDNLIIAVFSAMGLFNQTDGPLDTTKITKDRTWITSKMVPFSGHMTVERLSCPAYSSLGTSRTIWWTARRGEDDKGRNEDEDKDEDEDGGKKEEYVRIFVNDARQALHFCGAGGDGMCKLEEFLGSQEYAMNDGFGDFSACRYTGRYPKSTVTSYRLGCESNASGKLIRKPTGVNTLMATEAMNAKRSKNDPWAYKTKFPPGHSIHIFLGPPMDFAKFFFREMAHVVRQSEISYDTKKSMCEVVILWSLWPIKQIRIVLGAAIILRSFYRLIVGGYARQLRGWLAATYFPSVDLQKLCDSYHGKGEMGLPWELIDEIMRYNDLQTLKKCSLTSRPFYSAARPLIHRRMTLGGESAVRGWSPEIPFSSASEAYEQQADVFHARYLSAAEKRGLLRYGYVREVHLDLTLLSHPANVLQLQQLRALETVHLLIIESLDLPQILPIFDNCFSQFVPTLRSLSLQRTRCDDVHQVMEFICRFPHLHDLAFTGWYHSRLADAPPRSEGPRPRQPLPFGGHLDLGGPPHLVQSLVGLPGGIRFRSIRAFSYLDDLENLLAACSSTLEVLTIRYFKRPLSPRGGAVRMGSNEILRRFELVVDFEEFDAVPRFLHETLTSISSPHFSEFSLQLLRGFHYRRGSGGRNTLLWGAGWEIVDEDLYACAARNDSFRFVIVIPTGESTEVAVEALFPQMKSKGSLVIKWERQGPLYRW